MCHRPVLTLSVMMFVLLPAIATAQEAAAIPPPSATVQETDAVPPAHVAVVDGAATLERQGQPVESVLNMPLLSGDRLRTTSGRVEVAFADGSTLELDNSTTVDFQSDTLIRLIAGRVRVTIDGTPDDQVSYRVDASAGSVEIATPGDYRVALLAGDPAPKLELAVFRGQANLTTDLGATPVEAGQRAYASAGLLPSYAYAYNSAEWDPFDQWVEARHNQAPGASSQYLPDSMEPYAPTLDEYGDWRYAESYGYVWYPRVATGWRPYYYGRWTSLPSYGWTWVGADAFAWPTQHYGRWGVSAGAWFWIPGTRWSSAWVSWAYAPGYVSWCPLGFDNRPIFAFGFSHRSRGRFNNPWSIVRADAFGGRYIPRHHVPFERLDARSRAAFSVRSGAPQIRGVAVHRSAPIRAAGYAGGRAVPRSRANYFSNGPRMTAPGGPAFPTGRRGPHSSSSVIAAPPSRGRADVPGRRAVVPRASSPSAPSWRAGPRGRAAGSGTAGRTYSPAGRGIERSAPGRATVVPRTNAAPVYRGGPGYGQRAPVSPRTAPGTHSPYGQWAPSSSGDRPSYGRPATRSAVPRGASPYGRYAPPSGARGAAPSMPSMHAAPRQGGGAAPSRSAAAPRSAPRGGRAGGGHTGGGRAGGGHTGGARGGGGHHRGG